jgi:hypothetical protein
MKQSILLLVGLSLILLVLIQLATPVFVIIENKKTANQVVQERIQEFNLLTE